MKAEYFKFFVLFFFCNLLHHLSLKTNFQLHKVFILQKHGRKIVVAEWKATYLILVHNKLTYYEARKYFQLLSTLDQLHMKATGMVQISTIINVTTQQDYMDYWTECDYMIRCIEKTCKMLSLLIAIRATEHIRFIK